MTHHRMTARQFEIAIEKLGLSQVASAQLVGHDPRSARRWVADERKVPATVEIVMRLLLARKIKPNDLEEVMRQSIEALLKAYGRSK